MRRILWIAAAAALALPPSLFAQRTTGSITGIVKDTTGAALPGVTVGVTGPNIVGTQTSVTNESGIYRVTNLPPGDYQVNFALSGFKGVRKSIHVSVGAVIEENANLEVGQLTENIDVVGEAPAVDTTSNEVGSTYDRNWVDKAPLRRDSFFGLVASAPGSLQGGDSSNTTRTMVYGSSYDENAFQVDGVDITDNYFNEALAEPNTDAIEEVEVLSLGAPAEYGNLTGAVYNIVTRQGTNEFHGDAGFYWQGDGLTDDNSKGTVNPDDTFMDACPDDPLQHCGFTRDKFTDLSLQLGGPIIKDKLWFFASYANQRDYYWDVGVDNTNDLTAARGRTDRYFGKLNWQINDKHKLVGTFHMDKKDDDAGLSANSAPETAVKRTAKTPTPGIGYTGILSDRTVVEVRYSGFYGDVKQLPTDPNQPRDLNRFYDIDTGFISGGHYYWYDLGPKRTTITAKASHLADNFLGATHDFRFGVQYSAAQAGGLVGYNDLIYTYSQSSPGYGYGISYTPFSYSGDSKAVGVFLDDTVRVNDRLSLNLGVRYDYQKAFAAERPQLDESGNPTGTTFPEEDYFTWNNISPRLGFNLKLTGDGKTVLKGHYGRYHRAVATGEYANKLGESITPIFVGPYDTTTNTFGELTLSRSNENLAFDPNYKSPYVDQFIGSLERELSRGLGAQLNYVYKRGRDYAGWLDIQGTYQNVPYVDESLGPLDNPTGRTIELVQLLSDPEDRQFRISNPPSMKSDVNAVSFGLHKRMLDKWQLTASATWMRATGTLQEGQGGAGEAGSGVGIIQRGGLQFRQWGQDPNNYVNADGRLKSDVEWQFKVQAVYQLPAGFLMSANFSNRSGAHIVRRTRALRDITNVPENRPILLQPRGENGRLDSVTMLDMRLEKDFGLGGDVHLGVFADAFNLLNSDTTEGVVTSLVESSSYLFPLSPVNPRRVMLGAKFKF